MDPLIVTVLKPFARYCLRHALRMPHVYEALKIAYIEVAKEDLSAAQKLSTASALSAMTGLHRKDCTRLMSATASKNVDSDDLMTRVLGKWQSAPKYVSSAGRPRVLTCQGSQSEFFELVRSVSVDLNPYTVLNEFLRIGAIQKTNNGVKIISRVFIPKGDSDRSLRMMAREVDLFMSAVEENIQHTEVIPNLHINTTYDNIPTSKLPLIRNWILKEGSAFHDKIRTFLSKFDRDNNPKVKDMDGRETVTIASFSQIQKLQKKRKTR